MISRFGGARALVAAFAVVAALSLPAVASGKADYDEAVAWRNFLRADSRPLIGVALGGGGARGMAHIGFLAAMERSGIPVDRITGTSIGSFIASLYASGAPIEEVEKLAVQTNWSNLIELKTSRISVFSTRRLEQFIGFHLYRFLTDTPALRNGFGASTRSAMSDNASYDVRFTDLKIPFACTATDIYTGQIFVFDSGSVAHAVRASCSIPGLFEPLQHEGLLLIDGGVLLNLPVSLSRTIGANFVVAVDVESDSTTTLGGLVDILSQIIKIQGVALTKQERDLADIIVNPPVGGIKTTELDRAAEAVRLGEISGMQEARRIRRTLLGVADAGEEHRFSREEFDRLAAILNRAQMRQSSAIHPRLPELARGVVLASRLGLDREALAVFKHVDANDSAAVFSATLSAIRLRRVQEADESISLLAKARCGRDKYWELAAAAVLSGMDAIEKRLLDRIAALPSE